MMVMGHSAGGYNAAMLALDAPTDDYEGEHVLVGHHENIGHWLLYFLTRLRAIEESSPRPPVAQVASAAPTAVAIQQAAPAGSIASSISSRSAGVKRPSFSELRATATMTRSKTRAARSMMSRWPLVTGSKEPA